MTTTTNRADAPDIPADRLYVDGRWVKPSSPSMIDVIDPATEELYFRVAEALAPDMEAAIAAARRAFDEGPWPRLAHQERAQHLRAFGQAIAAQAPAIGQIWPRETGVLHALAQNIGYLAASTFDFYAGLADTFPFEERAQPTMGGELGLIMREPVGVVGAIVPWNVPLPIIVYKIAPALLAGCTLVLKASPEAPGEAYLVAQIAEAIGLPPGVLNVITADREVSELLVRDARVDKISFTGSTAAGRRIGSLCGARIGRVSLELGGKSAAVILDDADLDAAASALAEAQCVLSGQVCTSLSRVIVSRHRHDEMVDALVDRFSAVTVGDPFDPASQMGPLAMERQRDKVEDYIAQGQASGARLACGGERPSHLDRGWYVEPTVFASVDNSSTIAQEEIFGPVLSVIPADDEAHAVQLANDTIYGLNGSVFTPDVERAREVAGRLRCGTVGHNAFRHDPGITSGGFKQSGIGREGGVEGLLPFLETKTVVLDATPERYASS